MTELKQRLIELLEELMGICECSFREKTPTFEQASRFLIANGVTIRERGEWKRQKGRPEAICPFCEREVVYKVEDNRWWFEDFCPHCGADMRGGAEPPETEKGGE